MSLPDYNLVLEKNLEVQGTLTISAQSQANLGVCDGASVGRMSFVAEAGTLVVCDGTSWKGVQLNALQVKKLAFISSSTHYPSQLGGISGGDAICQQLANQSGFGARTFRAILSNDTTNARDRFVNTANAGYYRVDGAQVATSFAQLFSGAAIANVLAMTEQGQFVTDFNVATGSDGGGNRIPGFNCNNWTATTGNFSQGFAGGIFNNYLFSATPSCAASPLRIYCLED